MMPSWSSPIPTSSSARIIPLEATPRSFASPSVLPSGITAPGSATATVCPAATFGRAAHDRLRLAAPDVDDADAQAVGVRVLLGLEHAARQERRGVAHARAVQALELVARHRQHVGDLLRRRARVAIRAQPADRDPHTPAPNCSSRRRSFS